MPTARSPTVHASWGTSQGWSGARPCTRAGAGLGPYTGKTLFATHEQNRMTDRQTRRKTLPSRNFVWRTVIKTNPCISSLVPIKFSTFARPRDFVLLHQMNIFQLIFRLPVFQGSTGAYLAPLIGMMSTDKWRCPIISSSGKKR